MVSILWSVIALSGGLMIYCVVPILAGAADMDTKTKVGRWYYSLSLKSFQQLAFVDRILGGYELLPIGVDDERMMAEVTLSSGVISDDKKLPFKDCADSIQRLHKKPVTVLVETVPAALDAELCEIGHWVREHEQNEGFETTSDGETKVNPHVRVDSNLRVVNPVDATALVGKNIQPENIETAKELTKKRFSEYGTDIGAADVLATATGFGVGVGAVAGLQYLQQNLLGSGEGGSQPTSPVPLGMIDVSPVIDMAVMLL